MEPELLRAALEEDARRLDRDGRLAPATGPSRLRSMKSISWSRQKFAVKWTLLPPTRRAAKTWPAPGFASSSGVFRQVTGLVLLIPPCMKYLNSSCSNRLGSIRGPASSTTTEWPRVESCLASTPPAAPEPTITKSTSVEGEYFRVGCPCIAQPPDFAARMS